MGSTINSDLQDQLWETLGIVLKAHVAIIVNYKVVLFHPIRICKCRAPNKTFSHRFYCFNEGICRCRGHVWTPLLSRIYQQKMWPATPIKIWNREFKYQWPKIFLNSLRGWTQFEFDWNDSRKLLTLTGFSPSWRLSKWSNRLWRNFLSGWKNRVIFRQEQRG